MPRDLSKPTRQELSEKKDHQAETRRELREELEIDARDLSTIRRLEQELDYSGGTADGLEQITGSAERAEGVTEELFDRDDGQLAEVHEESHTYHGELSEHKDTSDRNLSRITDITSTLERSEAIEQIRESKEAALQDSEFLEELEREATDSLRESEEAAESLRAIRREKG